MQLSAKDIQEAGRLRKSLQRGRVDFSAIGRFLEKVEATATVSPSPASRKQRNNLKQDRKSHYRNALYTNKPIHE